MGNKRKLREKEEAKIAKKIKKLERKLLRRKRVISSSEDSELEEQGLPMRSHTCSPVIFPEEYTENLPTLISPIPQTPLCEPISIEPATTEQNPIPEPCSSLPQEQETQLEEEVLLILGEAPQLETALGKNIHKDIASRWQDILLKGLPKEIKESLLKKYVIPANCNFLIAPVLNPEAKAALSDILVKRDVTLQQKQNQIGVALAALSSLTEMILQNESSKQALLQPLSDACRLLCDSHNIETKTRRSIVMSSINIQLRDALANTNRDKYLFGEVLAESLKTARSVQKTGESLQKTNPAASSSKNTNFRNIHKNRGHNNLNSRGPIQKKPPYKTNESSRGRQTARQPRVTTHPRQRVPPPKASSPARKNYQR